MSDRDDGDGLADHAGGGAGRTGPVETAEEDTTPGGAGLTSGSTGPGETDRGADGEAEEILADEPLGESRRLDGAVRYQWLVGSTFGAAMAALLVTVLFQLTAGAAGIDPRGTLPLGTSETTLTVAVLAFLLFEGLAALRAVLLYRSWRYEVREDSLYLTRGVLTRVQTVAPYVRVQHVDTRRSPLERLLGLSSLVVYTAGSRGADVTIPGLTDERAAELQRHLKLLAIASEEDDAV